MIMKPTTSEKIKLIIGIIVLVAFMVYMTVNFLVPALERRFG